MGNNAWKYIAGGILLIAGIIVSFLPLKTSPVEVTETYYETEIRQEPYVANEPYVTVEMQEKSEVIFEGFRLTVPLGVVITFSINNIKLCFWNQRPS